MPKLTIHELFAAKKSGRTFTEIRTSNLNEALACAAAGVEMIMCMEEDLPVIRRRFQMCSLSPPTMSMTRALPVRNRPCRPGSD